MSWQTLLKYKTDFPSYIAFMQILQSVLELGKNSIFFSLIVQEGNRNLENEQRTLFLVAVTLSTSYLDFFLCNSFYMIICICIFICNADKSHVHSICVPWLRDTLLLNSKKDFTLGFRFLAPDTLALWQLTKCQRSLCMISI